jgi:hypothetical protein
MSDVNIYVKVIDEASNPIGTSTVNGIEIANTEIEVNGINRGNVLAESTVDV